MGVPAAFRIGLFSLLFAIAGAGNAIAAPRSVAVVPTGPSLLVESFTTTASTAGAWSVFGGACLTAGGSTTPKTSVPACGSAAALDTAGSGALQLTNAGGSQFGAVVANAPLSTTNGFQVVFSDATFSKVNGAGDGLAMFLADASQPLPTPGSPKYGGYLGYVAVAGGYVGVGFDEYGNFSSSDGNGTAGSGFPGRIQETVAVRGAYATNNQYLGGYTGTTGTAQSLPFLLDAPSATTRPAQPPTMRVTLTAASVMTVEIDPHDGNGYRTTYQATLAGTNGEPTLPSKVYLGFAASTGWAAQFHQIENLSVTQLTAGGAPAPTPTPAPVTTPTPAPVKTQPPSSGFVPTQISNLAAWYDASDATTLAQTAGAVSSWKDKSGNSNTLAQATTAQMPTTGATIGGLGALTFASGDSFTSAKAAFSTYVQNASTAFVVTNATTTTNNITAFSSGAAPGTSSPRWEFRPVESGATHFDFNNISAGRISDTIAYAGPTFWSFGGNAAAKSEFLSRDGTVVGTSTGPGATATGSYPLVVGGNGSSGGVVTYPYVGTIGEILVFNRSLTTSETQTIEGYLACKWGLQNQLPAGHPYATVCPGAPVVTPTPKPNPLPTPLQLFSANGKLSLTVVASQNSAGAPQLTYNGLPVPPTLRLLPGDTLSIQLTNALPAMAAGSPYLNDTNLHFHGLHVSPNAPADDSIDMLALPGQTLNYTVPIPANHPTGLYWYHSHAHGEVERQNLSGMSGALVIDGIASYVPSVANLPEQILIVRDGLLAGQTLPNADRKQIYAMGWAMQHAAKRTGYVEGRRATMTMGESVAVRASDSRASRNPYVTLYPKFRRFDRRTLTAGDGHCAGTESPNKALTLNGATIPAIGILPGQKQFWRLVNAGSDTYLDVAVDNAQMQVVAIDGVPISSGINTPASLTVNDYVVPPSSRVEFVVTGPAAGTTAYLRTNCFDAGSAGPAMPATILAVLDPTTSGGTTTQLRRAPKKLVAQYRFPNVAKRVSAAAPRPLGAARGARPAFTTVSPTRSETLYYSDQNTINGQTYDPGAAPQFYAQSGTVEEWTIVNTSQQVHTFHIHQIHFALEAIDGVAQSQEYVMDNVNVPAASASGPGSVKILLDFTDPAIVGTFLLHCHILSHEDAGMMAKIRVGTAPPLALASTSLTFASPASASQNVAISGGATPYAISGCGGTANGTIAGSTISVSPVATNSCVFTISDASGLTASLSVTVGAAAAAMTVSPTSLSFATASAPAQSSSLAGGTTPYHVSGCSGTATATINAAQNGVTVVPVAPGFCTLTIADSASNSVTIAVTVNTASSAAAGDNDTFHHDPGHTGWYSHETTLTTTNVASAKFGLLNTLVAPSGMPAFGKVYAQPLYVQNETASDGKTHNLVIIATTTDQVYAFDESTRAVVWEHNFTNAASGVTQQLWTDTGCADVNPNVGIVGTPVIDRSLDRLFVVVPTKENGVFHLRLHALSVASGADAVSPVEVTATVPLATGGTASVNAEYNFSRGALVEANGNVYVPLSSHCDFNGSVTHGWVLAFSTSTLGASGNAADATNGAVSSGYFLGTVWASGFGVAADSAGSIYFDTGNGAYNGTSDFAMSVLKLPGNLDITKASVFTPYGEAADSNADADLGSGGVVILPATSGTYPRMLIVGGKCGAGSSSGGTQGCQKYVLNRDSLGGFSAGDAGALWHADMAGGTWGGPATFQDASGTNYVIYGAGSPLTTYALGLNPLGLTAQSSAYVGCLECRDQGSQPIVSSNGTMTGTTIAWAIKTAGGSGGTLTLYAFDALNMGHVLFNGAAGPWTVASGASYIGGALVSPTVANGRVYVPMDGGVAVFGLSP